VKMRTDRQDFEAYARVKTFNLSVSDTWDAAMQDALAQPGRPISDVHVLDYGCGDGKYFHHLVNLGLAADNIHGVEISKLRVERCRALGWHKAVHIEKAGKLPYEMDTFDVVNLMEVIEHIPESVIASVLDEIHRVMKPYGVLIVSTPNYPIKRLYDVYDALVCRKWKRLKDDPTHVSLYSHARLRRRLEPYFARISERPFKTGFLYRRLVRSQYLMHKMLFLCSHKTDIAAGRIRAASV
jgi:SAM-dependent methyltransferase